MVPMLHACMSLAGWHLKSRFTELFGKLRKQPAVKISSSQPENKATEML
jgi:uncharacterized protein YjhX (UPF0386 family)